MNLWENKVISFSDIVFEERVKLLCFFCVNYNKKLTCPPNIPDLDYQKILSEYKNLQLITYKHYFTNEITKHDRQKSTYTLHKFLMNMEERLLADNNPMTISFIGGSCKLCDCDCNKDACSHPVKRRIPLEALGVNVIKTVESVGIKLVFPPKKYFYRIGLIVW